MRGRTGKKIYTIFGISALVAGLLFLFDLYKPYNVAVWLLYLLPLLFTSYVAPRWMALLLLTIITVLIGLGSISSPHEESYDATLLNRLIAVCALWITIIILLERKKAEDSLRESEERYRELVELSPEAIYIQQEGKFAFVNSAGLALFGAQSHEELLGKPVGLFLHPECREGATSGFPLLGEEEPQSLVVKYVRVDGSSVDVEVSAVPIDFRGQPAVQVFARDVTERNRLEERLRQSQKIEAVGRLAGGIAHDFNNLMTVITGYVGLTKKRIGDPALVEKGLDEIGKAGDRATRLTQQLIAFGRKQVLQPQVVDLNLIVSNMDKMLRRLIGEHIELVTIPARGLGKVRADPGQIEQVIINLALNGRDAMPRGGRLTIETANADLDGSSARRQEDLRPGSYVTLMIRDEGTGMDEKTKSHIFEPYFTTKEVGKGTGLGLATVYGIIRQSGGDVRVDSEPGKGTTFTIWLPRAAVVEITEEKPYSVPDAPRGWETVLVVEDETPVRNLVRAALEDLGYKVVEASDGKDALERFAGSGESIHLMLSDVVMPRMGGLELSNRMAALRPEMKVLFMTGYAEGFEAADTQKGNETPFLFKPFTPHDLACRVRDALEG